MDIDLYLLIGIHFGAFVYEHLDKPYISSKLYGDLNKSCLSVYIGVCDIGINSYVYMSLRTTDDNGISNRFKSKRDIDPSKIAIDKLLFQISKNSNGYNQLKKEPILILDYLGSEDIIKNNTTLD